MDPRVKPEGEGGDGSRVALRRHREARSDVAIQSGKCWCSPLWIAARLWRPQ